MKTKHKMKRDKRAKKQKTKNICIKKRLPISPGRPVLPAGPGGPAEPGIPGGPIGPGEPLPVSKQLVCTLIQQM